MKRQLLAAVVALCASHAAIAQSAATATGETITISIGGLQEYRRDDADSPIAYSGTGLSGRIDYERARSGRRSYITLGGGGAGLVPAGAIAQADIPPLQEAFDAFDLRAGTDWRLKRFPGALGGLSLGLEVGAAVTLVRHAYAGQGTSHQSFDLGIASAGPTARWSRRAGPGELVATLGVPVVAMLDHPYADVRYAPQVTHFRLVSLSSLRQADGSVSYELGAGAGAGIVARYRLSLFALDEVEPIRRVSQSLSLGIIRRFGGRQ